MQVSADGERFAIPDELQAQLDKITSTSCRVAEQSRSNPQFLAQQHLEDPLGKLERRLVAGALMWIYEVSHDPAPKRLEHRKQLLLPGLDNVSTPVRAATPPPPVRTFDENGKEYTKGFVFGAASGAVPLASQTVNVGIEMKLLPKGSYWARVGRACGEIAIGTGQIILGCAGLSAGATMTGTGGGAPAGIVVIAGSATLALNGCATASHGVGALEQVLRESEPVPDQPALAPGPAPKPAPTPKPQATAPKAQTTAPPPVATNAPKTGPGPALPLPPGTVHRNKALAGKKHPVTGVPFDADGYPDFRAAGVVEKEVKIKMTGKPKTDEGLANDAANLTRTPKGRTWHHHQDGTTMQLVPTDIHKKTGHTGGRATSKQQP